MESRSPFLHIILCLAVVTIGDCSYSKEVEDCALRFEDNGACVCSSRHQTDGAVTCYEGRSIGIKPCYCMFYDSSLNLSIVGHCYYSCYQNESTIANITSGVEFNTGICGRYGALNRSGRFCGQCNDSYGLAAYSYQVLNCIPCEDYGYKNWLRYFAVALLPLTIFYVLAVLLSFNVNSSSFNGLVVVTQCILSPIQTLVAFDSHALHHHSTVLLLFKIVNSILGVVNLDFFRSVYPSFCLHPEANIYQIMCLDYLVALYPFFLIFMTYVLVTAYDKRYRLVVWMWRPVQRCVHCHRNTWNIRTSLVEIFATFILFSYVKILGVTIPTIGFTTSYDVAGKKLKHNYAFLDGASYLGSAHLPYVLLAIAISSIFIIFPLFLLAVYPCRCFHKCLNCCGLKSQALHIFMDAFQGSYRTEPRDMRSFSAFYLLLRILMLMQFQVFSTSLYIFISGILSLASAAILTFFQPYKVRDHNKIDAILMILMGTYFISYHVQLHLKNGPKEVAIYVQVISVALILLYFFSLLVWKVLGGRLQAAVGRAKVAWSSILHVPRLGIREHNMGYGVESFNRDEEIIKRSECRSLLRE